MASSAFWRLRSREAFAAGPGPGPGQSARGGAEDPGEQGHFARRQLIAQSVLLQLVAPSEASAVTRITGPGIATLNSQEDSLNNFLSNIPQLPGATPPQSAAAREKKADSAKKDFFRIVRPTGKLREKIFAFDLPKIAGITWGQFDDGGKNDEVSFCNYEARFGGVKKPPVSVSAYRVNSTWALRVREFNYTQAAVKAKYSKDSLGILKDETTEKYLLFETTVVAQDKGRNYKKRQFAREYFNTDPKKRDVAIIIGIPEDQVEEMSYLVPKIFDSFVINPSVDEVSDIAEGDIAPELR